MCVKINSNFKLIVSVRLCFWTEVNVQPCFFFSVHQGLIRVCSKPITLSEVSRAVYMWFAQNYWMWHLLLFFLPQKTKEAFISIFCLRTVPLSPRKFGLENGKFPPVPITSRSIRVYWTAISWRWSFVLMWLSSRGEMYRFGLLCHHNRVWRHFTSCRIRDF